jgi:uncharacterized pyridoxal phosphate-dependent enzyme
MTRLEELGVQPLINAAGTYTVLGGSRLAPPVMAAMAEASDTFLDFDLLAARVGERIAALTGNEAACVTGGAAAGVAIAIAACVAGTNPERILGFPRIAADARVIVQRSQRNVYDYSALMTGIQLIEIGEPTGTTLAQLEAALAEPAACVLVFVGGLFDRGAVPLAEVARAAHARSVPVVVDAAAGIPPISNLRDLTGAGADLAVFSGGKGLRGPQTTGLVVGRRDLIEAVVANSSPRQTIGRPMKTGKEELLGILAAVEWSLAQDERAYFDFIERAIARWLQGLAGIPGITVQRGFPRAVAEPIPRVLIALEDSDLAERDRLIAEMRRRGVAVRYDGETVITLNAQTLAPDEVEPVLDAVRAVLQERAAARFGSA